MGTDLGAQTIEAIPITGPDNHRYQAHLDTQATLSVLPPEIAQRWAGNGARLIPKISTGVLANGSRFRTEQQLTATIRNEMEDTVEIDFVIMPTPRSDIILGMPAMRKLPVIVKYAGRTLFEGAPPVQVIAERPTKAVGDGINLVNGSDQQKAEVRQLLTQFKENMFEWSGKFGLFTELTEDIPMLSDKPVQVRSHRIPIGRQPAFKEIIQEYLDRKIIEPATSPYSAPAFLVPKGGADPTAPASERFRMCCNYIEVNKVIEDVMFPVFDVQQLLDALGSSNEFFATIDLRMGYHHVPLSAGARRRTAFSTPFGQFQFRVMPFGMKRAPRVFQRALHMILGDLIWKICLVYLDDIIIFGPDFATFLANLRLVLERLAAAGASISLKKSKFLAHEVKFLGFIVDKNSCRPTASAVEAVHNYPRPTTQKQLLRFIGLASYLRQFVPQFARLERLLRTAVTDNPRTLCWTQDIETAFIGLKTAIAKDATRRRFDPKLYTEVQCDASQDTVGAALMQGESPSKLYVLEYASATLLPHQQRYSNTEREMYAITWAVTQKFRPYLEGQKFVVATDHQALVHETRLKQSSTRMMRFRLKLESYQFTLRHIKGVNNQIADALSRLPASPQQAEDRIAALAGRTEITDPRERRLLIDQCHLQLGHAGWKQVWEALRGRFYWPRMRDMVWVALKECQQCITYGIPTTTIGTALQPIKVMAPMELVAIDLVPMPRAGKYKYMLIAIDHFSKFVFASPVTSGRVFTVIRFLNEILQQVGPIQGILSDPGPQFRARALQRFAERCGIQLDRSGRRHFEGNGCLERVVRTISEMLARMGTSNTSWPQILPAAVRAYNHRQHSTTQAEPVAVLFQVAAKLPLDTRHNTTGVTPPTLEEVQQCTSHSTEQWRRASRNRRPEEFLSGTAVFHVPRLDSRQQHAATRRFRPRRFGPFVVLENYPRQRALCTDGFWQLLLPSITVT
jgi:transposase InsO family protein